MERDQRFCDYTSKALLKKHLGISKLIIILIYQNINTKVLNYYTLNIIIFRDFIYDLSTFGIVSENVLSFVYFNFKDSFPPNYSPYTLLGQMRCSFDLILMIKLWLSGFYFLQTINLPAKMFNNQNRERECAYVCVFVCVRYIKKEIDR